MRENNKISEAQEANGFDISQTKIKNKRQVLRNCTESEVGSHIIEAWALSIFELGVDVK